MIPDELRAALAEVTRAKAQRLAAARRVPQHLRRVVLRGLSSVAGRRYPDMDANLSKSIEEITVDLAQRLAKLGFTLEIKRLPPRK